ncbi:Hypothetical predicted protein [Cloeon dipterum]|uniref:Uncharacterized protein n=1 Tax=Cloeon dipterum TaxID=197152 RepID=A0A8S1D7X9_9INSE|nr:Hypothetical predicted protein [Cloeon dipterum]
MAWRSCVCGNRIPGRAFVAGVDEEGHPLHVARGLQGRLLLPGPLDRIQRTLVVCVNQDQVHVVRDHFDVLMDEEPLRLRWQEVTKGDEMPRDALVVAQYRRKDEYLGRVTIDGAHYVGRVRHFVKNTSNIPKFG